MDSQLMEGDYIMHFRRAYIRALTIGVLLATAVLPAPAGPGAASPAAAEVSAAPAPQAGGLTVQKTIVAVNGQPVGPNATVQPGNTVTFQIIVNGPPNTTVFLRDVLGSDFTSTPPLPVFGEQGGCFLASVPPAPVSNPPAQADPAGTEVDCFGSSNSSGVIVITLTATVNASAANTSPQRNNVACVGTSPTAINTCTVLVVNVGGTVPLPAAGVFVIGDLNAVVGNQVNFWGAQWWKENSLSGGTAPAAFKGFVDLATPSPPTCGGTWTTRPGNSSDPPPTVPSVIAVIVSSNITQAGPVISGNVRQIVLVQVDPGYGPNPGHRGNGRVVGVVCP